MKLNINDNGQTILLFNLFKKIFFLIIIIYNFIIFYQLKINSFQINNNYIKIENNLNMSFHTKISQKINIAIYGHSIQNGGRARITTFLIDFHKTQIVFKNFFLNI